MLLVRWWKVDLVPESARVDSEWAYKKQWIAQELELDRIVVDCAINHTYDMLNILQKPIRMRLFSLLQM